MLFDWKENCFLCAKNVSENRKEWHLAQTLSICQTIIKDCTKRLQKNENDAWALAVKGRVNNCVDFVATEARYHQNCRVLFSTGGNLDSNKSAGRRSNTTMESAFEKARKWLEKESELHSVSGFAAKVEEFAEDNAYTNKYLIKLLQRKYGDHIMINHAGPGKENIIAFQNTAQFLIEEKFKKKEGSVNDEKERMINIVGNLIKDEIRAMNVNDAYPSPEQLSDSSFLNNWLPQSLKTLLEILIPNELKRIAIGHSAVKACRKNLLSPLLFGLGIELDHSFGSKLLNNHLSRFGFSITNDEVRLFKQTLMEKSEEALPKIPDGSFVQWIADNFDHNVRTLDGKGTFHGMGIIAAVTPSIATENFQSYKRSSVRKSVKEITAKKGIPIIEYFGKATPASVLKFKPYEILQASELLKSDVGSLYDLMWLSTCLLPSRNSRNSSWSGYMQSLFSERPSPGKPTVIMLPIIDLQPSDPTCIYSTLKFVESEARKLGVTTPCITFDQPLWYKATAIIQEKKLNIVCRLGGFHLLMSFLGSIGTVMSGSGIEDLFEEAYATNVIHHLLSGKAYARSLRGHMLIHSALLQIIMEELIENDKISVKELEAVSKLETDEDVNNPDLQQLHEKLDREFKEWQKDVKDFRTATYWIQYLEYIKIVKFYIRAERTGNWLLHLSAVEKMLNLVQPVIYTMLRVLGFTCSRCLILQKIILNCITSLYPVVTIPFVVVIVSGQVCGVIL